MQKGITCRVVWQDVQYTNIKIEAALVGLKRDAHKLDFLHKLSTCKNNVRSCFFVSFCPLFLCMLPHGKVTYVPVWPKDGHSVLSPNATCLGCQKFWHYILSQNVPFLKSRPVRISSQLSWMFAQRNWMFLHKMECWKCPPLSSAMCHFIQLLFFCIPWGMTL